MSTLNESSEFNDEYITYHDLPLVCLPEFSKHIQDVVKRYDNGECKLTARIVLKGSNTNSFTEETNSPNTPSDGLSTNDYKRIKSQLISEVEDNKNMQIKNVMKIVKNKKSSNRKKNLKYKGKNFYDNGYPSFMESSNYSISTMSSTKELSNKESFYNPSNLLNDKKVVNNFNDLELIFCNEHSNVDNNNSTKSLSSYSFNTYGSPKGNFKRKE
uniref:CUE domain-containing protein n=1 Tax=Parastrongyloides trichosuri TaxID=131310 RepID=A0A0N4ZFQ7_PARTI